MPRIFISYRRADSSTFTGRIYDRLLAAFGDAQVFKDVDDIPAGVDFRRVLDEAVSSSDVLLAVIGPNWIHSTGEGGQRRLDDPNDFVRIELESALARPDMRVIPVLVGGAKMPTAAELPASLHDLPYRNAVVVRDDPDFNRDIERLVKQIRGDDPGRRPLRARRWLAAVALVAVIVAGLLMLTAGLPGEGDALCPVEAAPDQYLVLVAQMEQVGTRPREVARFVHDNLKRALETEAAFSRIAVRPCATVVTSAEQARSIAQAHQAPVIVWGNYDDNRVELEIQLGSTGQFEHIAVPRDMLERTVNVRARLTDEREESVVPQVMSLLTMLHIAEGDWYETARSRALYDSMAVYSAPVVGSSPAARTVNAFTHFTTDTTRSISEMDAAITQDARNPLLYLVRGLSYQRQGESAALRQDMRTAIQLSPGLWAMPHYLLSFEAYFTDGDVEGALAAANRAVEAQSDYWYSYYWRGQVQYFAGNYAAVREDAQRAIELGADTNLPYLLQLVVLVREGDLMAGAEVVTFIFNHFPDPESGNRMLDALYSSEESRYTGLISSAISNLLLGQYERALNNTELALSSNDRISEIYLLQGVALCNLGDFAAAQEAFSQAVLLEPDYTLLYALRADAYRLQNDLPGMLADLAVIGSSEQAAAFAPYLPLMQSGDLSPCVDFANPNLSEKLKASVQASASDPA